MLHHGLVGEGERSYQEGAQGTMRAGRAQHAMAPGLLLVTGDGPRIGAAQGRVDQIARRLRKGGDARTLAQLSADVATDLLLRGWIPNDPTFAALGEPPAAQVQLIVSLPTLLGIAQGAGQIPGWGAMSGAEKPEQLALAAGSIWKRVVTDPLTGGRSRSPRGPTRCRPAWPNRSRPGMAPAGRRDARSPPNTPTSTTAREWKPNDAGGPTAETNLAALHRGHHNLKTAGFWDSDQSADGSLHWTTATGRTVTTYPYIYDHPDDQPVKTSTWRHTTAADWHQVLNPDIPLPGHLSIFDEIRLGTRPDPRHPTAQITSGHRRRPENSPRDGCHRSTSHHRSEACDGSAGSPQAFPTVARRHYRRPFNELTHQYEKTQMVFTEFNDGRAGFGEHDAHGAAAAQGPLQNHEPGVRQVEQLPAWERRQPRQSRVGQDVTNQDLVPADHQRVTGRGQHDSASVLDDGANQRVGLVVSASGEAMLGPATRRGPGLNVAGADLVGNEL